MQPIHPTIDAAAEAVETFLNRQGLHYTRIDHRQSRYALMSLEYTNPEGSMLAYIAERTVPASDMRNTGIDTHQFQVNANRILTYIAITTL